MIKRIIESLEDEIVEVFVVDCPPIEGLLVHKGGEDYRVSEPISMGVTLSFYFNCASVGHIEIKDGAARIHLTVEE